MTKLGKLHSVSAADKESLARLPSAANDQCAKSSDAHRCSLPSQIPAELSETVRQMDADLRVCGRPAWACGTTLVALLVTQRSLTVANVGDSRAVLCRAGVPLPLSRDHKPKVTAERQRILQAGGFIVDGRVNGDLSLSRALGDFRHKVRAGPNHGLRRAPSRRTAPSAHVCSSPHILRSADAAPRSASPTCLRRSSPSARSRRSAPPNGCAQTTLCFWRATVRRSSTAPLLLPTHDRCR